MCGDRPVETVGIGEDARECIRYGEKSRRAPDVSLRPSEVNTQCRGANRC